jgi:tripartite-type tricarboxylate transporter receptor subunit TctC
MLDRISAEAMRVLRDPGFVERHLISVGLEPAFATGDEFASFLKQDRALAERLVRESGFRQQ